MKPIIKILSVLLLLTVSLSSFAQSNEEITLTVSSDGSTKDKALKNALRSALEQSYGAFVSANTTILNDELVKDEIVTTSTGAIKEYSIVSESEKPNGTGYIVTAKATVSLPHLISYAKNHGSECEFAGNAFAMQVKLFELQKENEEKTILNLISTIKSILPDYLRWELVVEDPRLYDGEISGPQKTFIEKLAEDSTAEAYSEAIARLEEMNHGQFYKVTANIWATVFDPVEKDKIEKRIKEIMSSRDMKEMIKKRKKELANSGWSHRLDDANDEANRLATIQAYIELTGTTPYTIIKETLDAISIPKEDYKTYINRGLNATDYTWEFGENVNYNYKTRYFRSDRTPALLDSLELTIGNALRDFVIVDNLGNSHYLYPFELDEIECYERYYEPSITNNIIAMKKKYGLLSPEAWMVSLKDDTLFSYPVFIEGLNYPDEGWRNNIIVGGFNRIRGIPGITRDFNWKETLIKKFRDFNWEEITDPYESRKVGTFIKQFYTPVGKITFSIPREDIGKYSSFKIVRK